MPKDMIIPGTLIVILALFGAGASIARSLWQSSEDVPASAPDHGWSARIAEPRYRASHFETNLLQQVHVTLPQAIAAAEKDAQGRAIDAFLDVEGSKPAYRIRLLQSGNAIATDWVDAASGQIKEGAVLEEADWSAYDRLEIANLHRASITLAKAIALAQRHDAGHVVNADGSNIRGQPGYGIDLVARGEVISVVVAPGKALTGASTQNAVLPS